MVTIMYGSIDIIRSIQTRQINKVATFTLHGRKCQTNNVNPKSAARVGASVKNSNSDRLVSDSQDVSRLQPGKALSRTLAATQEA